MLQNHVEIAHVNAVLGLVIDVYKEQNQLVFGS